MRKTRWLVAGSAFALLAAILLPAMSFAGGEHCRAQSAHAKLTGADCTPDDVATVMIEAHGGLDAWRAKRTLSYRHTMVAPYAPDDPWVSVEVVDNSSRREYQEWPLDHARIAYDGEQVWSVNWKRANPPKFMVNMAYYFINLPWLTRDDGVNIGELGQGKLPGEEKTYVTVMMTFDPGVGETPEDYYKLFVDPDTGLLKGVEYIVTYGAMLDLMKLPADQTYLGPLTKVYTSYEEIDGLKVPATYRTFAPNGQVYGEHKVENFAFDGPFDESMLQMPEGAVVDHSSAKRAAQGEESAGM